MPRAKTKPIPTRPARDNPLDTLHIETIGHVKEKRAAVNGRFPFDGIGLVFKGEGFYQVNHGTTRRLVGPGYFTIWPGPRFYYGPHAGQSWDERFVCFSGQRVADWLRWHWLPRKDEIRPIPDPEMIGNLHDRITQAQGGDPMLTPEESKLDLERFVYLLQGHGPPAQARDALDHCIDEWTREPEKAGDLNETARALGMSYSGFRHHFTRRTGRSPHQFLLARRIEVACNRLARSDDSVKAIALDSGFHYAASFNRAFLSIKNVTPGEYRRRVRLLS